LYCDSKDSFLNILRPMFSYLDSLYWIVDCQQGPVSSDWIYESNENERLFTEVHLAVPALEATSAHCWRPGSLSKVGHVLYFDECCYFLGFDAAEAQAVERAERLGSVRYFTPLFYDLLAREGQLFAVEADGWWEFSPATEDLFARVKDSAVVPCREIRP